MFSPSTEQHVLLLLNTVFSCAQFNYISACAIYIIVVTRQVYEIKWWWLVHVASLLSSLSSPDMFMWSNDGDLFKWHHRCHHCHHQICLRDQMMVTCPCGIIVVIIVITRYVYVIKWWWLVQVAAMNIHIFNSSCSLPRLSVLCCTTSSSSS